jgi:hypothetical protein
MSAISMALHEYRSLAHTKVQSELDGYDPSGDGNRHRRQMEYGQSELACCCSLAPPARASTSHKALWIRLRRGS